MGLSTSRRRNPHSSTFTEQVITEHLVRDAFLPALNRVGSPLTRMSVGIGVSQKRFTLTTPHGKGFSNAFAWIGENSADLPFDVARRPEFGWFSSRRPKTACRNRGLYFYARRRAFTDFPIPTRER